MKIVLAAMVLILSGCDQLKVEPVSLDGQPIVGHWFVDKSESHNNNQFHQRLYMHLQPTGYVTYVNLICRFDENNNLHSESRLKLDSMPIKRINVKKIVLQNYPLTPQFQLQLEAWPDENNGVFVVDKLPLQKIEAANIPDFESWQCQ